MIQLLAATEPDITAKVIAILAALLGLASLVHGFRRKPPIEAEFVTKKEFGLFKQEIKAELSSVKIDSSKSAERILDKLDELRQEMASQGERRAIAIHNRINDLERQVARLDERTIKRP